MMIVYIVVGLIVLGLSGGFVAFIFKTYFMKNRIHIITTDFDVDLSRPLPTFNSPNIDQECVDMNPPESPGTRVVYINGDVISPRHSDGKF